MTKRPLTRTRTVVVTGASGGVGRAVAREFAGQGCRVALLARGRAGLDAVAREVRDLGGQPLAVPVDVADAKAVEDAAAEVEERLGPIDVWVNNAFAGVFAPFVDITPDEFRRVTEVTYLGYVYGTRAALRRMLPRDSGTVVQVGSALAYRGIPLQSAYCGAKHAIQGFNESLRCELLHSGTRVRTTMVQLPAVNTPQFDWVLDRLPGRARPVPPVYQPEVAARAIAHAARHGRRREYWVGGSTVATLVANAVVPAALERYLGRTGFASQMDDGVPGAGNLWAPADGAGGRDFGARGRFSGEAHGRSVQGVASRWRNRAAGVALGGVLAGWWLRSRGAART
ncbi:SDR family oxidoreductase [Streptomyces sp. NPDC052225]|uniref:SDR family oxidoreductase n=1 Tax=Streptomyces sp. NPDC052225 TaxID=3154949 RepID=UPI0034173FBA